MILLTRFVDNEQEEEDDEAMNYFLPSLTYYCLFLFFITSTSYDPILSYPTFVAISFRLD